jgi:hypothetical protein
LALREGSKLDAELGPRFCGTGAFKIQVQVIGHQNASEDRAHPAPEASPDLDTSFAIGKRLETGPCGEVDKRHRVALSKFRARGGLPRSGGFAQYPDSVS